jgi:YtkA-like
VKNILLVVHVIIMLFALSSCKKNSDPISPVNSDTPQSTKIKLSEVYKSGTKIGLYADDSLRVGYNALYLTLTDSALNSTITQSTFTLTPVMQMTSMSHSTPVEQPGSQTVNGYFQGAASFLMASSGSDYWIIQTAFSNPINGKSDTANLPIIVSTASPARLYSFTAADDGTKIFVSLIPNTSIQVGSNDFEVLINYRSSMMSFPPLNTLTTEIKPWMPDMGHGSSNNVNPVLTSNGHYKGSVNYTMTGTWVDSVFVKRNGVSIGAVAFQFSL